jgi:hypothetical protein
MTGSVRGGRHVGRDAKFSGRDARRERERSPTAHRLDSRPVVLQNVRISGTLDLRPLGVIRHQFVCRDCFFQADLIGAGVIFDRALDLSGSRITGAVRARWLQPLR